MWFSWERVKIEGMVVVKEEMWSVRKWKKDIREEHKAKCSINPSPGKLLHGFIPSQTIPKCLPQSFRLRPLKFGGWNIGSYRQYSKRQMRHKFWYYAFVGNYLVAWHLHPRWLGDLCPNPWWDPAPPWCSSNLRYHLPICIAVSRQIICSTN